ncbi:MAG: hypothetical protein JWO44_1479 [Bacteroidetes bacterium]|jgi:hypothetical protein|nr:hypothetical protein [Bacteroidota bacterium]
MADYSNSKFEITILSPRIFRLRPFEGVELDEDDAREMRKVYLRFSDNRPFAILLDASADFTPTNEARVLLASREFTETRIAAAFVTRSLANKLIGNFFIRFNKPASPTRMFNDEPAAFEWLLKQVEKFVEQSQDVSGR